MRDYLSLLPPYNTSSSYNVLRFFETSELTEKLRFAFIVYLISGNRPISEMINPNRIDQRDLYEQEFKGMTNVPVTYEALEESREHLITELEKRLTQKDREFLMSFKEGTPRWELIDVPNVMDLPAVKWKLNNIQKLKAGNPKKHRDLLHQLQKKLKNNF